MGSRKKKKKSGYTLMYNPQQDMFTGIYYQATIGQSFEVIFVRTE
jgi:hypothetical protein